MEMQHAYEFKALVNAYKAAGLENAEALAGAIYNATMNWAEASAKLSTNPYDDLAVPFRKQVDQVVLPQIDKIDKQVG